MANELYLFRTLGNSYITVAAECKGGPDESAKVSDWFCFFSLFVILSKVPLCDYYLLIVIML